MTYDKEFEEIIGSTEIDSTWTMKDRLWFIWQAARKDHYRIGEEVESITNNCPAQIRAVVDWDGGCLYELNSDDVRRIPAWTPKEGEAVFYLAGGIIRVGKIMAIGINGHTAVRGASGVDASVRNIDIKPFYAEKIGKPWGGI